MSPRLVRPALHAAATAIVLVLACSGSPSVPPFDGLLPLGTWGGDSGGMIVGDTAMHLHIGCTFGDVSGRVPVDANGRFDVTGSYMLRAYPITVGPAVPARFTGTVDGDRIVVTATIDDTIAHQTVVHGPVSLRLGVEPNLGPCPICRRPVRTRSAAAFRRRPLTAATARARPPTT